MLTCSLFQLKELYDHFEDLIRRILRFMEVDNLEHVTSDSSYLFLQLKEVLTRHYRNIYEFALCIL